MKIVRTMETANGALPIIFTIILVHSISYIKPERPERKKQQRTRKNILLVALCEVFFLAIIREKDLFFQEALIPEYAGLISWVPKISWKFGQNLTIKPPYVE